ncbi:hypothetical protein DNTS_030241 [Danionella cerebrum]|uniref:unspecific monooxygenase n=1 Tax=Danionella cerebrum TaxID=2873325 RepID=A0A553Q8F2_9TELE|nr:hypothetical protein DNTS_030241 [Danionella translucida]
MLLAPEVDPTEDVFQKSDVAICRETSASWGGDEHLAPLDLCSLLHRISSHFASRSIQCWKMVLGGLLSVETWALLALLIALLLVYGSWPHSTFKNMSIPGPRPVPFFGTMLEYRKGFHIFDLECFKKFGRIWGIYDARQPALCIMDPSIIKTVLVKECYSLFTNRRQDFPLKGELHDAVSITTDDDWKRIRSVLSPSFTSGRLKEMFGIMKTHSQTLVDNLSKVMERGEAADIKDVDIDSLNNPKDPFVSHIKKMLKFDMLNPLLLIAAFFPFLEPMLEKMDFTLFPKTVTDFFYSALQKIKSDRVAESQKKRRVDLLQLMVDSQSEGKDGDHHPGKGLTDHEILSQSMIFIFAGYETTSNTLSLLFHNLATHHESMKALQQEIDLTFPDEIEQVMGEELELCFHTYSRLKMMLASLSLSLSQSNVSYEALMTMDYLDAALNETLRLYPVAPRVERMCKKTVEINGLLIPKDMAVVFPTYAIHRDPEHWDDPESFKPERFTKGNRESINPYTFMPFGQGPRNCIGMRFAQVSMKLATVRILQRYNITLAEEAKPFSSLRKECRELGSDPWWLMAELQFTSLRLRLNIVLMYL